MIAEIWRECQLTDARQVKWAYLGEGTRTVSAHLKQRKGEPRVTVITATKVCQAQTKIEDSGAH